MSLKLDTGFWKNATVEDVAKVFDGGVDVEAHDDNGCPPLFVVMNEEKLEVISFLLDRGADIEARIEGGFRPLHWAVGKENLEVISLLLGKGADIESRSESGWTSLHFSAANSKTPEVISLLLDRGANAKVRNNDGKTPFDLAKENEHLKGTDVYWRLKEAQTDMPALTLDADFWKTATVADVVKILDSAEIEICKEKGFTPLYLAVTNARLEAISLLLDTRDKDGNTPLHWAARFSKTPEVISLLLDRGANAKVRNNDGKTPFDLAKENEHLKGTDVYWRLKEAQYDIP